MSQRIPSSHLHGVIIVDKPIGLSSASLSRKIGHKLGKIKIGHAGTLDPFASGVLPLCLGEATKISQYLMLADKVYEANLELGCATDTYDSEGEVLSRRPVPDDLTQEQIDSFLDSFRGRFSQVPPPFSAKKVNGVRSYHLARKKRAQELPPVEVTISELDLLSWQSPMLRLKIRCSKGTYIRSLAHDFGEQIGCGAHLRGLKRTGHGQFQLDERTLAGSELAQFIGFLQEPGASLGTKHQEDFQRMIEPYLLSMNEALGHLPGIQFNNRQIDYISQGRNLNVDWLSKQIGDLVQGKEESHGIIKILGPQEHLVALIAVAKADSQGLESPLPRFKYLRVFN